MPKPIPGDLIEDLRDPRFDPPTRTVYSPHLRARSGDDPYDLADSLLANSQQYRCLVPD